MRKCLLFVAAVPLLLLAPPAFAEAHGNDASCPPPEVTPTYDAERLAVNVRLRATGCPSRERREFMLSAFIGRFDAGGFRDGTGRSLMCGPFPTMADLGRDDSESFFFCEVDVVLDHPAAEDVRYEIDVAYPGADSTRTTTIMLACRSDGDTAACDR